MNAENFVYLVGAGISIDAPSGIPPGAPILQRLIEYVAIDASAAQALRDYADPDVACKQGLSRTNFLRFEGLIERISDIEPTIFSALAKLESNGRPNTIHQFLVDQANAGALVLTTNFDCRIEQAALNRQSDLRRFVVGQPVHKLRSDTQLIKLHGSFPHPHFRNATGKPIATLTQIARFGLAFSAQRTLRKHLEQRCLGRTLVVAGYSASDSFDVTPLIENLPWKEVIWVRHDNEIRPEFKLDKQTAGVFGENVLFDQPLDMLCLSMLAKYSMGDVFIRTGPTSHHLLAIAGQDSTKQDMQLGFYINSNLTALDTALAQRPLDERKRRFICNTLLNESYGQMSEEIVGETFDDESVDLDFEEVGRLFEERNFVQALVKLEEIYAEDTTYYTFEARLKAKLEFAEYMFNDRDVAMAKDTALSAERLARKRGCAWALVQAQRLLAKYELEISLHKVGRSQRCLLRQVIARQAEAVYYSLRSGFVDDAFDTLRLLIHCKSLLGDTNLEALLEALHKILPHVQSPEVLFPFYEREITLAIERGDASCYRRTILILEQLCREMQEDVFAASIAIFRSRWHLYQGRKSVARQWLSKANEICAEKQLSKRFLARLEQLASELAI